MVANPPTDMPRITPHLFYDDVGAAIDFLSNAFGFPVRLRMTDDKGLAVHGELEVGPDSLVMIGLTGENPDWECPRTFGGKVTQRLYIFIDDIDAHYAREGCRRHPTRETPRLRRRLPRIQCPRPRRKPLELRHRPSSIARARAGPPETQRTRSTRSV